MLPYEEVGIETGFIDRIKSVHRFVAVNGDNDCCRRAEGTTNGIAESYVKSLSALAEPIINDEGGDRFGSFTGGKMHGAQSRQIVRAFAGRPIRTNIIDRRFSCSYPSTGDDQIDPRRGVERLRNSCRSGVELYGVWLNHRRDDQSQAGQIQKSSSADQCAR